VLAPIDVSLSRIASIKMENVAQEICIWQVAWLEQLKGKGQRIS